MLAASHTGPLISSDVDGRMVVESRVYRVIGCLLLVIVWAYGTRLVLVFLGLAVRPSWMAVGLKWPAEDGMS